MSYLAIAVICFWIGLIYGTARILLKEPKMIKDDCIFLDRIQYGPHCKRFKISLDGGDDCRHCLEYEKKEESTKNKEVIS